MKSFGGATFDRMEMTEDDYEFLQEWQDQDTINKELPMVEEGEEEEEGY
jgi:hypothetical protein